MTTIARDEIKSKQKISTAQHLLRRLQNSGMSELEWRRIVKEILAKYGVTKISELSEAAIKPVIAALSVALVQYLGTIAPVIALPKNCKSPPPNGWQRLATQDPDILSGWATLSPNQNWGWTTNAIDVDSKDPKEGERRGTDTWAELIAEHGEPDTFKTLTPSGGCHYLILDQLPTRKNTLGDGVDTRGAGTGYVVAPGSYVVADGKNIRATGYYKGVPRGATV